MKVILVDDEPQALVTLCNYILHYAEEFEIIGTARDLNSAVHLIDDNKFDVLFLDINLGSQTGFDVLNKVKNGAFKTVFVTAYDEYALKAFKYAAIDYLLKPLHPDEFMETVKRLRNNVIISSDEQLDLVQESISSKVVNRLVVTSLNEISSIEFQDIVRMESYKNYTDIYTKNGKKITASKTIKHFEELLPPNQFFRIHQRYIVNLSLIKKYLSKEGSFVELVNGEIIEVSRRRKGELLKKMGFKD
ncbi:MAG: response regulator transcription factor [Flavobacteriaceae bacterium]|nr:response regulator transcription factor [Flavobacteriaceae bacterium]